MYGPVYEFYDNVPVPGREEYYDSEKYEVKRHDWKKTNRMTDIITLINKARNENPAFQSTWNMQFCHIEDQNLLAFSKQRMIFPILFWWSLTSILMQNTLGLCNFQKNV